MKALLYTKPNTFEYTDFDDPKAGPDEVLIRVKAAGICGSDVHGATGETGRRLPPLIMGHEAAGIVEAAGANIRDFQPGDRVCFDSTVYCNRCDCCRKGLVNRCDKRQVLGVSTPQFKRHGAFAEFVTVPSWIVSKLPDDMTFEQAALLEPVSIGMHAANRADIQTGDTALVIGAGTIGLFVLQAAKLKGAAKVIISDVDDFRLGVAADLGADVTVNPQKQDLLKVVEQQTAGTGVNVSFEVVGLEQTFGDAVKSLCMGGRAVAVGNIQPKAKFNLQQFIASELTVTGSYASSGEFRQCIDLVAGGRINVGPLISDIVPLEQGSRAFERLLKAEEDLLKIVLQP